MVAIVGVVSFLLSLGLSYQVFPNPGTGDSSYVLGRIIFTLSITVFVTVIANRGRKSLLDDRLAEDAHSSRLREQEEKKRRKREVRNRLEQEELRRIRTLEAAQLRVGQLQAEFARRELAQRDSGHRQGHHDFGVVADRELAELVWDNLSVPFERRTSITAEQLGELSGTLTINQSMYPPTDVDLEGLQYATGLEGLVLNRPQGKTDLTPIAGLKNLRSLTVWVGSEVEELDALATLDNLNELCLRGLSDLADFRPLAGLRELTSLKISDLSSSLDCDLISGLKNLRLLESSNALKMDSVERVVGLALLEHLVLRETGEMSSLKFIERLHRLHTLQLEELNVSGSRSFKRLTNLRSLAIKDVWGVSELAGLADLDQLQSLELSDVRPDSYLYTVSSLDLEPLAGLRSLAELSLAQTGHTSFTNWRAISHLANLTRLDVSQDSNLGEVVEGLSGLFHLRSLRIACANLPDLGPLVRLQNLKSLELVGELIDNTPSTLYNFKPVSSMRGLEALCLDTIGGRDLMRQLGTISSLKHLTLKDVQPQDVEDLRELANLQNLESLELTENPYLVLDLAPLAGLQRLTSLTVVKRSRETEIDTTPLKRMHGLSITIRNS